MRIPSIAAGLSLLALAACNGEPAIENRIAGADIERGRMLIAEHGCQACHRIPGVRGPKGIVGPPLDGFGRRVLIAGSFPNTPDNLVRWIAHPTRMMPVTAMPDMGIDEAGARHIAAFLYTLR
ncbi:MAG TPA: c-type cytochrome [Arenibaculum sp.]|nr:c-type cytochrome [Arenibaculum sp.]